MYSYYKNNKTFVWIYGTWLASMILFFTYIFGMYDNIGNVGKILVLSTNSVEEHYVFKVGNVCYIQRNKWDRKNVLHKDGTLVGDYNINYTWTLSRSGVKVSSDDRYWFYQNCVDPVDEVSSNPDVSAYGAQPH